MIRTLIIVFAITAGGIAAWLALSLGSGDSQVAEAGAAPLPTREVLVASTRIAPGDRLGPVNLGWNAWPEETVSEGMLLREELPEAVETYTDWIARAEFLPGEPLRLSRLADGEAGLLSLVLTPGMRATAIRTSAETSAGGFVLPNDRVDVVHTELRDIDRNGVDEPVSATILQNVRVLAVDQTIEQTESGPARVGETVTLELRPQQVELLTTARNSGRLSLSLRSVADFDEVETGEVAMLTPPVAAAAPSEAEPMPAAAEAEVADAVDDALPMEQPEPGQPSPPSAIRIIGSGQVKTVYVDLDGEVMQ